MVTYKTFEEMLQEENGIIKLSRVCEAGSNKASFYDYVSKKQLRQLAPGVYSSPHAWEDEMYVLHLRSKQIIFSHDTALFLHGLTDRDPISYSITVKTGYNPTWLKENNCKVFTIKPSLHEIGLQQMPTVYGNMIPVYNMERIICDVVSSRNELDQELLTTALKRYVLKRDKNLHVLAEYAKMFRLTKVLRQYLEFYCD